MVLYGVKDMSGQEQITQVTRKLARDLDAHFEDVVSIFQGPLFAYAYRMSGCRQDAEEVVQDAFIRAYHALRGYEPDRIRSLALQAWLYRICTNLTRNRRRQHTIPTTQLLEEHDSSRDHSADSISDGYERRENAEEMQLMLSDLPPKYRSAVVLHFVNQLSYPEIAAALDQPEGTVKSNVHRGLNLLRQELLGSKGETT